MKGERICELEMDERVITERLWQLLLLVTFLTADVTDVLLVTS